MEESHVRFGALTSADVKLWLTGLNDAKYERNPVHLHSVILKRSEFFKVKMSERWSSDKPTEIRVTISHNFDVYLKCIELMYGEWVYFSNVEECLAILSVASELLADDLINKCMQYLEAVRWSSEQESQIRDTLSSLGLKLLPDLAARFDKECIEHIIYVEKIMKQMVFLIQGQKATKNKENAEKYIADIFEGNTSKEVVEICERELLQGFKSSIHSLNFLSMKSIFEFIELCEGEILKAAFIAFVEDSEFRKQIYKVESHKRPQCDDVVIYTINWFMKATGDGRIIISRASRISFLITWLPIMVNLCRGIRGAGELAELDKAMVNVVESLPVMDKIRICVEWIELYSRHNIDNTTPLTLFIDLQDARYKSTSKE